MAEVKKCKVVLLGEAAVGKTALIRKYVKNQFDEKYISTIGTVNSHKFLQIGDKSLDMIIWDLMGQHITDALLQNYLRGADGALMVGDLTKPETFGKFSDYWGLKLNRVAGHIPVVLLGNKYDLVVDANPCYKHLAEQKRPLEEQGFTVVNMYLTSAKTGKDVETAFLTLGKALVGA